MKRILVSRCASIEDYVFAKKPNRRIPFKGDFPIVKNWEVSKWREEMDSHIHLDECSEWFQETVAKGMKIESISTAFNEYLNNVGVDNFDSLKNEEKADWLVRFMNKNCMTLNALRI